MDERLKEMAVKSTAHAVGVEMSGRGGERPTPGTVDLTAVEYIIGGWGEAPHKVAHRTIEKYGPPNEATSSRLIWFDNGPWKRTIVYRDEVPHNFPKPHTDLLEQFVDYRVPPARFSDLAAYDGSVVAERTKGEICALRHGGDELPRSQPRTRHRRRPPERRGRSAGVCRAGDGLHAEARGAIYRAAAVRRRARGHGGRGRAEGGPDGEEMMSGGDRTSAEPTPPEAR